MNGHPQGCSSYCGLEPRVPLVNAESYTSRTIRILIIIARMPSRCSPFLLYTCDMHNCGSLPHQTFRSQFDCWGHSRHVGIHVVSNNKGGECLLNMNCIVTPMCAGPSRAKHIHCVHALPRALGINHTEQPGVRTKTEPCTNSIFPTCTTTPHNVCHTQVTSQQSVPPPRQAAGHCCCRCFCCCCYCSDD